jgi:hypothetical protein
MKKLIFILFLSTNIFSECIPEKLPSLLPNSIKSLETVFDKIVKDEGLDPFYTKRKSVKGILILSSNNVSDEGIIQAGKIVDNMLSNNSEIIKRLVENQTKLAIFGDNEKVSTLPEMRDLKGSKTFDGRNRDDICGTGGVLGRSITTVCESNLLKKKNDPYFGREDICTHEFAHTIMNVGFSDEQKNTWSSLYQKAKKQDLYKTKEGKVSYEMENEEELFAVLSGIWFKSFDKESPIHTRELSDRESIKKTFPEAYEFLKSIYK